MTMCTRFVYRGDNIITGFNFDIDIVEWNHKVINTKDCFYIGIMRPDGMRHSYHGVNRNGNVGTLLYVHGNLSGTYQDSKDCITIADLVEKFIQAEVSFDDVLQILKERKIVYAADATMQAMLSDKHGRRVKSQDDFTSTVNLTVNGHSPFMCRYNLSNQNKPQPMSKI